jgi:predicted hydrolase (HD superfamily)
LPLEAINAIKGHNYIHTGYLPTTYLDKALIAADAVSGLVIASALVMPNKKLSEVKISTLEKKEKDSSFAKGCDRKRIQLCQDLGMNLEDFLKLSLSAMKKIHKELGL